MGENADSTREIISIIHTELIPVVEEETQIGANRPNTETHLTGRARWNVASQHGRLEWFVRRDTDAVQARSPITGQREPIIADTVRCPEYESIFILALAQARAGSDLCIKVAHGNILAKARDRISRLDRDTQDIAADGDRGLIGGHRIP